MYGSRKNLNNIYIHIHNMTTNNGRYVVKVYLLIQVVTLQIISYVSIEVSMTTEMKVRLCNLRVYNMFSSMFSSMF